MNENAAILKKRPPFMALWCEHRFRVDLVARDAGVDEEIIFTMLGWHPVEEQDAAKVLATLTRIYECDYNLKTVWVKLREEDHENAEVAVKTPRV